MMKLVNSLMALARDNPLPAVHVQRANTRRPKVHGILNVKTVFLASMRQVPLLSARRLRFAIPDGNWLTCLQWLMACAVHARLAPTITGHHGIRHVLKFQDVPLASIDKATALHSWAHAVSALNTRTRTSRANTTQLVYLVKITHSRLAQETNSRARVCVAQDGWPMTLFREIRIASTKTSARRAQTIATNTLIVSIVRGVSHARATGLDTTEMVSCVRLFAAMAGRCLRKGAMTTTPRPLTDALQGVMSREEPYAGSQDVHGIQQALAVKHAYPDNISVDVRRMPL